ncbi:hypothetical protein FGB62_238g03 [Gracilaria domingensis]|nr:hypothetical protein FGB62_238g03 [Gracilaria domingensis]
MTVQPRRKATIQAKQLSLFEMERVLRHRVRTEVKKMYSLVVQEDRCVPPDYLSRLFRTKDPPIHSHRNGYSRMKAFDTVHKVSPRHSQIIAKYSIPIPEFGKSRVKALNVERNKELHARLRAALQKYHFGIEKRSRTRLEEFQTLFN